jgi:hypothetical protein
VQGRLPLRLLGLQEHRKNSLRAFATIRLPLGLIIHDVVIGQGGRAGRAWALLPSKPMIDGVGPALRDETSPVNEWGTRKLQSGFSRRVIARVRAQYPRVLDSESEP